MLFVLLFAYFDFVGWVYWENWRGRHAGVNGSWPSKPKQNPAIISKKILR